MKFSTHTPVYILGAKRTPIGSLLGSLQSESAPKLGAVAIRGVLESTSVEPDAVYMGQVLTAGAGQAPARQAAMFAGLPDHTPTATINKVCGSGMQTVIQAANEIALGFRKSVVAGGMESMSQVPYLLPNVRSGYRLGHGELVDGLVHDGLWDVYKQMHMGSCAEICAADRSISREDQDEFAIESYRRAQQAIDSGRTAEEITPVILRTRKGETIADCDEEPGKANFEKLPTLRPVFEAHGTITAANASTLNDGAAALFLGNAETAEQAQPLARVVGWHEFAGPPEWFTTAPGGAIRNLLAELEWEVDDVDVWEINEAFSLVAIAAQREFAIPSENLNPCGGAVAMGHPIGASGTRILVTLVHELRERNARRGVAAICIGGGEGLAVALEL